MLESDFPGTCERCRSITSTPEGLQALVSEEGFLFKPIDRQNEDGYWYKSNDHHDDCTFCDLLKNVRYKIGSPYSVLHLFAQVKGVQSCTEQYPFQGQKLEGFCLKVEDEVLNPKSASLLNMNDWPEAQLSCYAVDDTRVASILMTKSTVLEDLKSQVFGQVAQQIKSCLRHHKKCRKKIGYFTPKRLINVGNKAANETPRLCETENNILPYLSLSYCWGEKHEGVTTSKTYDSYLKELPLSLISRSIRDAIEVARGLGFQYLWVDALCIKQDDEDDKMSEINAMGQIYRNATATIAAANSTSANHGFLGDFPLYSPCKLPILLPSGDIGTIFTKAVVKMESLTTYDTNPLDSRGWALQEFLLSPRTLHFGLHDLTWHCQTKDLGNIFSTDTSFLPCSSGHHPRQNAVSIVPEFVPRLPPSVFQGLQISGEKENLELMKFWLAMVANYSRRSFTNEKDRLPALAGLASEIQMATGIDYLGGVWESDLISQLTWRSVPSKTRFEPTQATVNTDRRPSWSWMSAQNGIIFEELKTEAATSLSCNPVAPPLAQQSSFTTICGCRLLLLAKIVRASHIGRRYEFDFKMDYEGIEDGELDKDTHWMLLGHKPRGNSIGLVLQPTKSGEFVRIGLIKVPKGNKLWADSIVELREILLV